MLTNLRTRVATWVADHPVTVHYMPMVAFVFLASSVGGDPTNYVIGATILVVVPATMRIIHLRAQLQRMVEEDKRVAAKLEAMTERMSQDMARFEAEREDHIREQEAYRTARHRIA